MSTSAAWAVFVALLVIVCGVVGVLVRTELGDDSEPTQASEFVTYTHTAPGRPFTVTQAHRAMQQHRTCRREDCPRKRAAFRTLVEARRIRPDSGRAY
ncbi:hypothetical protein [Nocardia mexicana]|uniref:Uncharacterized protein n=1 Tax=Nocardia mexicana TaxID=279262 RepID=A0A370GY21_9NOCA|nr:hypothetical protein [Nocardia mexicana]RDI48542.1 hypothetical protein DFR68_108378 [Nocardia mexicana]